MFDTQKSADYSRRTTSFYRITMIIIIMYYVIFF